MIGKYLYQIFAITFICSLTIGASCNSSDAPETEVIKERKDIVLSGSTRAAAEGLTDFYVNFTADAVSYVDGTPDLADKNVVVSPLSEAFLLAMVANGVKDDVKSEIINYLGFNDVRAVNDLAELLLAELPSVDNKVELKLANSIWVNNRVKLLSDYSSLIGSKYGAYIDYGQFDDNPGKMIKTINRWCSDNTGGLIKEIIDNLDQNTIAVMLNALYFKGKWEGDDFLPKNTKPRRFDGIGKSSEVDMMYSMRRKREYSATDNFEAFSLYFGNTAYSLMIVLPNEKLTPSEAVEALTPDEISVLVKSLSKRQLAVYMPKFKIDTKYDLNAMLGVAGLEKTVSPMAFGMFDSDCEGIMKFSHATSFRIDEEGATAAAASSGESIFTAAPIDPNETYTIEVNRPFFFFINEVSTGACVLSGRIASI